VTSVLSTAAIVAQVALAGWMLGSFVLR